MNCHYRGDISLQPIGISECTQSNLYHFPENEILAYISDIHLDYKLSKNSISKSNVDEMKNYFHNIIEKMYHSIPIEANFHKSIVFVGDISYDFNVFKVFFEEYRKVIQDDTIVVLGNHELWNIYDNHETVDKTIEIYKSFLSQLTPSIIILENEIWFPNNSHHVFSADELLALEKNNVDKLFDENPYAIFGSIGFAGNNQEFNQHNGLYVGSKITRQEEIIRSKKVDVLHRKLKEFISDELVIFATHMPLIDWSTDIHNPRWIYLNGHTHRNYSCLSEEKHVFANNQIGYSNSPFSLKYIISSGAINLNYYSDGIHEITSREYLAISYKLQLGASFNRPYEKMFMIKRNGLYMFFVKLTHKHSIKILCGGQIRKAKHDLQYYYDNICEYAERVAAFITPYLEYQKKIADEIKFLGGSGSIHGSIVDIDGYNHLFINPVNMEIIPYYAITMKEKYFYRNICALLSDKCPSLYSKYISAPKSGSIISKEQPVSLPSSTPSVLVEDTSIYGISLYIKNIQCLIDKKVVRFWDENLMNNIFHVKALKQPKDNTVIKQKNAKSISVRNKETKRTKTTKKSNRLVAYIKELERHTSTISVIDYNVSSRTITYRCLCCDYSWTKAPQNFKKNRIIKCPKCKK